MDVGVDREEGHAACEHEDAGGGFGSDAGESGEVVHGLLWGEVSEEAEGDASVVGADALEDVPDAGGLLTGETGHADGTFDELDGGVGDGVPGGECVSERAVSAGGVAIGGGLAEDGGNEGADFLDAS